MAKRRKPLKFKPARILDGNTPVGVWAYQPLLIPSRRLTADEASELARAAAAWLNSTQKGAVRRVREGDSP